jgi:hypothetical protein
MIITGRVNIKVAEATNYLILGYWSDKISYKLSGAGIPVVIVPDGTSLGYSVYSLKVNESTTGASPSGSGSNEWRLVESAEFVYMQQAYIERLQAAIVTAERIEALKIRTSNIEILEGAIVGGTLNAVSGSFKRLDCLNPQGEREGYISFSEGSIIFANCSLLHQGATGPFRTNHVWSRGDFGTVGRTTALVSSGDRVSFFPNGLSDQGYRETAQLKAIENPSLHYIIPLYPDYIQYDVNKANGMPIDLIIIRRASSARYALPYAPSKQVTIINPYEYSGDIYMYFNNKLVLLRAGTCITATCVSGALSDSNSSAISQGWFITGSYDNTFQ